VFKQNVKLGFMLFETQKGLFIDVGHLSFGQVDKMFRLVKVFGIGLWGGVLLELLLLIGLLLLFYFLEEFLFGVLLVNFFEPVVKEYGFLVTQNDDSFVKFGLGNCGL
jgi:hypothetical protein